MIDDIDFDEYVKEQELSAAREDIEAQENWEYLKAKAKCQ